jgi:hypothetical protein
MSLNKFARGLLGFNLAALLRAFRHGHVGLSSRLRAAYDAIDPFDAGTELPAVPLSANVSSLKAENSRGAVDKVSQLLLQFKYQDLLRQKVTLPHLNDVEFQNYSQNREDGILLFLFSILGTTNKRCVEICAGDGMECNSANLIVNHNWDGLLFDGSEENVANGNAYYASRKDGMQYYQPRFVKAWITAENINDLIRVQGFEGEIDLLSLDIDGIDYWIWNAIECVQPRVVVLEYNSGLGSTRSVTIPNKPDFVYDWNEPYYGGASLPAFVKLGRKKGYRLIGAEKAGVNAFFVRSDLATTELPEIPVSKCTTRGGNEAEWFGKYQWVEV